VIVNLGLGLDNNAGQRVWYEDGCGSWWRGLLERAWSWLVRERRWIGVWCFFSIYITQSSTRGSVVLTIFSYTFSFASYLVMFFSCCHLMHCAWLLILNQCDKHGSSFPCSHLKCTLPTSTSILIPHKLTCKTHTKYSCSF
jgi:hypothetical protein